MKQREEVSTSQESKLPEAQGFPELAATGSELIYGLYDRPSVVESFFVAVQHVLAAFVGIVTPPLIICTSLGFDAANTSFIISMSLLASGICTFIQCKTFGPVGSGLLSLQGTSFAFLGAILGVGGTAIAESLWWLSLHDGLYGYRHPVDGHSNLSGARAFRYRFPSSGNF